MFFETRPFTMILMCLFFAGLIIFVFAVGGFNLFTAALIAWIFWELSRQGIIPKFRKSGGKNVVLLVL